VDQHIAHERVLYEQLIAKDRPVASQELLMPETFSLDKEDQSWFEEARIGLSSSGFQIDEFGGGQYLIRAVPHVLMGKPIKSILKDSLQEIDDKAIDTRYNRLLATIACKAAVKAGDKLTHREREDLIRDWLSSPNNMSCPHGRPIVKRISFADMAGWFMRGKHE
jgi:DNA mismatch repair protein MutL